MPQDDHISLGLSDRDYQTITAILAKYDEVKEVRIFGSRAKGVHKQHSDIDLAVMNEGVSDRVMTSIKSDLSESTLPYNTDVVNFPALDHSELKEHILRVGKPFYKI